MPGEPDEPFDPFTAIGDLEDPPAEVEDVVEAASTDTQIQAWAKSLADRREPVEVFVAPSVAGPGSKRARAGVAGSTKRSYPRMMALVDGLPEEPVREPIPRTFVPNRAPKRRASTARPEVEDMLTTMADGLLIGGDDAGKSEVRIMLSDEFFRGTELRIGLEGRRVTARFYPPDVETYRTLVKERARLIAELESQGLSVRDVEVVRP